MDLLGFFNLYTALSIIASHTVPGIDVIIILQHFMTSFHPDDRLSPNPFWVRPCIAGVGCTDPVMKIPSLEIFGLLQKNWLYLQVVNLYLWNICSQKGLFLQSMVLQKQKFSPSATTMGGASGRY